MSTPVSKKNFPKRPKGAPWHALAIVKTESGAAQTLKLHLQGKTLDSIEVVDAGDAATCEERYRVASGHMMFDLSEGKQQVDL